MTVLFLLSTLFLVALGDGDTLRYFDASNTVPAVTDDAHSVERLEYK